MPQSLDFPTSIAPTPTTDSVTFVGNATVILHINGITLLTDPNFLHAGDHAHLGYGMTSRRLTNPAFELAALPPFDAVLLSHYHGDHFDHLVERALDRQTPIVTNVHCARTLAGKGFRATYPLATWETLVLRKGDATVDITAVPGKHGPGALAAVLPPVMGSLIACERSGGRRFHMYISGDTLIHNALREIPRRFPRIDLALLHLGGTRIMGVLVTLDGKGGVDALRIINPQRAIPIHYEEYTVMKSPLADFILEVRLAGYENRIVHVGRGDTYAIER